MVARSAPVGQPSRGFPRFSEPLDGCIAAPAASRPGCWRSPLPEVSLPDQQAADGRRPCHQLPAASVAPLRAGALA